MKIIKVPFAFLRAVPEEVRGEQLNVGLVAFFPDGPEVFVEAPVWRMKALHPDLGLVDWLAWAAELEETLFELRLLDRQLGWLKSGLGAVRCDGKLGQVESDSEDKARAVVDSLVDQYVRVPLQTISVSKIAVKHRSRLQSQLRNWFRSSKVFSPRVSDLGKSKIVPSYPIDVNDDLYADFALKNGSVHIIETLDFRGVEKITKSLRGEASLAAIMFDQARMRAPEGRRIAVTAADDYSSVRPLVGLINKYADDVVALESAVDRQRLGDFIASALKLAGGVLPFEVDRKTTRSI